MGSTRHASSTSRGGTRRSSPRPSYVGKILFIRSGEALSLQYHERKEETLRVLDGELEMVSGAASTACRAST
jgi:mannose-6-phosphate isomerase-like protein (cupin superfamily)